MNTNCEERKNTIIKAGREAIIKGGYDALSMREIAKTCGISVGTLYNCYKDKDELVNAIITDAWEHEMERARAILSNTRCAIEKARVLYDSILTFETQFVDVWCDCTMRKKYRPYENGVHLRAVNDLKSISGFDRFIIEILLRYASLPDQNFRDIENKLRILL